MPMGAVQLTPGVNVEPTPTLLRTGYASSSLVRFRGGLAEKLGGWQKFYPFSVTGTPRALHAWQDLNQIGHLSVGTTAQWGAITNGSYADITPETFLSDITPNFSTTSGSATVVIVDSNIANVTTYDSIFLNTPIAIGGLVLSGLYAITLVLGTTNYQITAAALATGTVNNAGAVPSFTTTSGSAIVTVTIAAHGLTAGTTATNKITFPITTSVGGVSIMGTYTVNSVLSSSTFTITANGQASSGATVSMNSGNAELLYYIALGPPATGTGYSVGTYSSGGYSTGSTNSAQTGTDITSTDWSFDNWGALAIGCPANGGIYYWDPSGGFANASLVSQAPIFNGGAFVAMPAQILVAWGSTTTNGIGVSRDPLLVSWSDQLNFFQWTASLTTQAGSYEVPTGSQIVGGLQAPQTGLIWTDIDLYSMRYIGGTGLIFGFTKIASGCGLIARHARCVLAGIVYWFSQSNVFRFDGNGVSAIPCSVWDVMFQDLDTANLAKAHCGANTPFNEVWFFYPSKSGGTGECDRYIKFNVLENTWDYGPKSNTTPFQRTSWIDQSAVLGYPISCTPQGVIYKQEFGYDADTAPMQYSFTTGWFYLAEGEEYVTVDRLLPDFIWGTFNGAQTAQVSLYVELTNYSGDTPRGFGPYLVTQSTEYVPFRARGRQARFTVSGADSGSFIRMGRLRYRYQTDGRR